MQDPIVAVSIVAMTFLLAGMVKGVIGMGLPLVSLGILGIVMTPVEAVALLVVPSFVTNVWQLVAGPSFVALLSRFATLLIGVCVGTAFGIGLLTGDATALASGALGTVLALYGVLGLVSARVRVRPESESWLSPIIGILTGALAGATGVFAIPAVPYFSALGLEKEELVQMLGILFTVCTVTLATGLMVHGRFPASVATGSLLALIPTLVGMLLGQLVRNRLNPWVFRRWFCIALVVLGAYMAVRALVRVHG